jgi:transposase-like protein
LLCCSTSNYNLGRVNFTIKLRQSNVREHPKRLYRMHYAYFLSLSLGSTSKAIQPFEEGGSHIAWVQKFNPKHLYHCKRVSAFLNETMSQIGAEEAWLWAACRTNTQTNSGSHVSRHRNIIVAELLRSLIIIYARHIVYSDAILALDELADNRRNLFSV